MDRILGDRSAFIRAYRLGRRSARLDVKQSVHRGVSLAEKSVVWKQRMKRVSVSRMIPLNTSQVRKPAMSLRIDSRFRRH